MRRCRIIPKRSRSLRSCSCRPRERKFSSPTTRATPPSVSWCCKPMARIRRSRRVRGRAIRGHRSTWPQSFSRERRPLSPVRRRSDSMNMWGEPGPPPALLSNALVAEAALPKGCLRDIDHAKLEHRRIRFGGPMGGPYNIATQLLPSPDKTKLQPYGNFKPDPDPMASLGPTRFDAYLKDNIVDWDATDNRPRHA